MKRVTGMLAAWGLGLLLLGVLPSPAAALTSVTSCGSYGSNVSLRLDADLVAGPGNCLAVGSGVTIDMNGHSISGLPGDPIDGIGISGGGMVHIKGPGIVAYFGKCIELANSALVQDVLVYNCEFEGIKVGHSSKCVECRVHDIVEGTGIEMGPWCLLESSIVETSQNGAVVGHNCKVWDLVVDGIDETGLKVGNATEGGGGTSVARTVISHVHDGPGIDYCDCGTGTFPPNVTPNVTGQFSACQDSSNSVSIFGTVGAIPIKDKNNGCTNGKVVTDCATNQAGQRYIGTQNAGTDADCTTH